MRQFHAVMVEMGGREFGVSVKAASEDSAYSQLEENYPESTVVQLESLEDMARREQETYTQIVDGWDDWGEEDF